VNSSKKRKFQPHPDFDLPDADRRFGLSAPLPWIPPGSPGGSSPGLLKDEEAHVFKLYNFARRAIFLGDTNPAWKSRVQTLEEYICRQNISLIHSVINASNLTDREESESLLLMILLSAVRAFNVEKGYRFSTYATFSLKRNLFPRNRRKGRVTMTPFSQLASEESYHSDEGHTSNFLDRPDIISSPPGHEVDDRDELEYLSDKAGLMKSERELLMQRVRGEIGKTAQIQRTRNMVLDIRHAAGLQDGPVSFGHGRSGLWNKKWTAKRRESFEKLKKQRPG
jgi:hypothetical protein